MRSVIKCFEKIHFPYSPPSPFLFCAYHKDLYPPAKDGFNAPHGGSGKDFNPDSPYRMYHGIKIPGFPQHPHCGFESLTCTLKGYVDHFDSKGYRGRYGEGDIQWMTAGKGVCHSEMFPLIKEKEDNTLILFQIWLNLPSNLKNVNPIAKMIWANEVPKYDDDLVNIRLWAGDIKFKSMNINKKDESSLIHLQLKPPVPYSYANDPKNDVAIAYFKLKKDSLIRLEPASHAKTDRDINRLFILINGQEGMISKTDFQINYAVHVDASQSIDISNPNNKDLEVLFLQGRPINEPVVQHGPFVMNTQEEVSNAYDEYQKTGYGNFRKWWSSDSPINETRSTDRFYENTTTGEKWKPKNE